MEIDHVFASGAVVGRVTTHLWGRQSPRCVQTDSQPHSSLHKNVVNSYNIV